MVGDPPRILLLEGMAGGQRWGHHETKGDDTHTKDCNRPSKVVHRFKPGIIGWLMERG
jgi:hypothetical protein